MKIFLAFLLLIIANSASGQKLEVFGGVNRSTFRDGKNDNPHYRSSFEPGYGFTAGLALDSIIIDRMRHRFSLQVEQYRGKLDVTDGGLAGSYTTTADVRKTVLSLGFYPLNFMLFKRMDLSLGFVVSVLLHEKFTGRSSGYVMSWPPWNLPLQEKYDHYSSSMNVGLQGRIAYDIKVSRSIWISPQYHFHYGLLKEFIEFPDNVGSIRQYFCVGLKKKIGNRRWAIEKGQLAMNNE